MGNIAVIGGGAAGLFFAGLAARDPSNAVTVFEKNAAPGRKLLLTGKGRCNVTNNCARDEFLQNVPRNPKFLYTALDAFSPADAMAFFESLGVPLKTERGRRVFPVSDSARDIRDALVRHCRGCAFVRRAVTGLRFEDGKVAGVEAGGVFYPCEAAVICTGGLSYPATGSTGDGYAFARAAGHTVTEPTPSLVPLECADACCAEMAGLSLKNVVLRLYEGDKKKPVFEEMGEMLFTHFGISGPLVLSASAHMRRKSGGSGYTVGIDLKPALNVETLNARILSDFDKYKNRDLVNSLGDLLPSSMISPTVRLSGIPPEKKVNAVTRAERYELIKVLKSFPLTVTGFRPIDEAVITSGGVKTSEIDPRTMESKLVKGLYFAGEVIDVDAYTGGYNLQIAFSTAYLAARANTSPERKTI